jgi:large subunit ribosomal protein L9
MDLILVKDVAFLGKAGETITVKDGYARNFLIPQGLALAAIARNRERMDALRAAQAQQAELAKAKAVQLADRLSKISCTIPVLVGEQGKLHGAVTAADIMEALEQEGVTLEKRQLVLEKPLSHCGAYQIPIRLHPEVTASLKVEVVKR